MKRKSRIVCFLLIAMLAVGLTSVTTSLPVFAAKTSTVKKGKTFTVGNLKFKVTTVKGKKGTVTLVGTTSKDLKTVTLPNTVKLNGCTFTLNAIGKGAFKNCTSLKKVTTNKSLKTIGNNAFLGCSKLKTVVVKGNNLEKVGKNALKGVSEDLKVKATVKENTEKYSSLLKGEASKKEETPSVSATPEPEKQNSETDPDAPKEEEPTVTETPKPETEEPAVTEIPRPEQSGPTVAPNVEHPRPTAAPEAEQSKPAVTPQAEQSQPTVTPKAEQPKPTATPEAEQSQPAITPDTPQSPPQADDSSIEENPSKPTEETCSGKNHIFSDDWKVTKEPTCSSYGSRSRTCKCGKVSQSTDYGKPTGLHKYRTVKTEPTCTVSGSSYEICEECGKQTNVQTIPALGHEMKLEGEKATPSCDALHITTYKCSRCDKREYQEVKPTGHTWMEESSEPTCTQPGYTWKECSICGKTESKRAAEPALGHNWENGEVTEATCITEGSITRKCSRCGVADVQITSPRTGHSWGEWTVTAATCTVDGTKIHSCNLCGYTETKTIPALGHLWGVREADGFHIDFNTCGRCGAVKEPAAAPQAQQSPWWADGPSIEEIPSKPAEETCSGSNHIFSDDWKVTKDPTCSSYGSRSRTCKCGKTSQSTDYGKPTGIHNYKTVKTEATCTASGSSYEICEECGKQINLQTLPALGHDMQLEGEATPSCDALHITTYKCSRCDKREYQEVKPTGHTWVDGSSEPTCTLSGYTWKECSSCGKTESKQEAAPALGHSWNNGEVTEASCISEGTVTRTCTKCGATNVQITSPKTGHSWGEWTGTAATCTENGSRTRSCNLCQRTETETVPALGHKWGKRRDDGLIDFRICARCSEYDDTNDLAQKQNW